MSNVVFIQGDTVLSIAVVYSPPAIVSLLLAHGAAADDKAKAARWPVKTCLRLWLPQACLALSYKGMALDTCV